MADEKKPVNASGGLMTQTEKMQAGRRAKGTNRASNSDLSSSAKFCLRILAQARTGAKLVQDQVKAGRMPPAQVIDAAAVLAGAAANSLTE